VYLLDRVDLFNLLCVSGETTSGEVAKPQEYAQERHAFCVVDAPKGASLATMQAGPNATLLGAPAPNSALYYPWVKAADPPQENRMREFPPCGFVARVYARTDATGGVWKAPAGSSVCTKNAPRSPCSSCCISIPEAAAFSIATPLAMVLEFLMPHGTTGRKRGRPGRAFRFVPPGGHGWWGAAREGGPFSLLLALARWTAMPPQ